MPIDYIKDFRRYLKTKENSDSTIDLYTVNVTRMNRFLQDEYGKSFISGDASEIKGYMISNWVSSIMQLKFTTRTSYIGAVSEFLKFLYTMQYIDFKLHEALPKLPSVSTWMRTHPNDRPQRENFTPEQVGELIDKAGSWEFVKMRNRAMIAVFVTSGLRASELAALNVGDIRREDSFVEVARKGTHGNLVRAVISKESLDYVNEFLRYRKSRGEIITDESPLFLSSKGNRMNRKSIYKTLALHQKKLGLPTGPHIFRHTALTAVVKIADPIVSRDVGGQKCITVNNQYLHSTEEELEQAASKLAEVFLPKKP